MPGIVSTLLCQVKRRLPVAVVELYGTLDDSSAAGGIVALRERLAEQPTGLVIDATHLSVIGTAPLRALIELAATSVRWPGARIALGGASPGLAARVAAERTEAGPDLYDSADQAVRAALRTAITPRHVTVLAPDRQAPARARALAGAACREWGRQRLGELTEVIVSELVTNAVVHARTRIEVTVRLMDGAVGVAVRDGDPRLLAEPGGGVAADGRGYGRGLLIVDVMADAWGCVPTPDGKVVWARVGLPGPAGAAHLGGADQRHDASGRVGIPGAVGSAEGVGSGTGPGAVPGSGSGVGPGGPPAPRTGHGADDGGLTRDGSAWPGGGVARGGGGGVARGGGGGVARGGGGGGVARGGGGLAKDGSRRSAGE